MHPGDGRRWAEEARVGLTGLGKSLYTLLSTSCLFLKTADKRPGTVSGGVNAVRWWRWEWGGRLCPVEASLLRKQLSSYALFHSIFLFSLRQLIMLSGLYSHICFQMGVGGTVLSVLQYETSTWVVGSSKPLSPSSFYCPPTLILSHLLSCSKSWCDCVSLTSSWLDS